MALQFCLDIKSLMLSLYSLLLSYWTYLRSQASSAFSFLYLLDAPGSNWLWCVAIFCLLQVSSSFLSYTVVWSHLHFWCCLGSNHPLSCLRLPVPFLHSFVDPFVCFQSFIYFFSAALSIRFAATETRYIVLFGNGLLSFCSGRFVRPESLNLLLWFLNISSLSFSL